MNKNIKPEFTHLMNLASEKLGAKTISCSDDFFAPMENLLKPGRGIFIADKYTEYGKWMDGWESRRKRTAGHDWCIIKLAESGIISGFDIDTNHFLGNHPPHCSIEAAFIQDDQIDNADWIEVLDRSSLNPGSQNFYATDRADIFTHLRLNIFPDGGVARLKAYGEVRKDWSKVDNGKQLDLAAAIHGGKSVACNDMFFSHMDNLIMPGYGVNMGDGWETKRNRTPNNKDWVVIKLAHKGNIQKVVIDTKHFKGNYPDSFMLEICDSKTYNPDNTSWKTLIAKTKLSADSEHIYTKELEISEEATHAKLSIFPDGGISRLRLLGTISKRGYELLNTMEKTEIYSELEKCCGAKKWIDSMIHYRPYKSEYDILQKADWAWKECLPADACEAFLHHPQIGDKIMMVQKFANTLEWAENEQSAVSSALDETIEKLLVANKKYLDKFGYIFIVYATGKSAEEMLQLAESRITNTPEYEINIAMSEQHKITKLRLLKLLS